MLTINSAGIKMILAYNQPELWNNANTYYALSLKIKYIILWNVCNAFEIIISFNVLIHSTKGFH